MNNQSRNTKKIWLFSQNSKFLFHNFDLLHVKTQKDLNCMFISWNSDFFSSELWDKKSELWDITLKLQEKASKLWGKMPFYIFFTLWWKYKALIHYLQLRIWHIPLAVWCNAFEVHKLPAVLPARACDWLLKEAVVQYRLLSKCWQDSQCHFSLAQPSSGQWTKA